MFTTPANLFTVAGRISAASQALVMIGHLRDLPHNSQSGTYAMAGIMVAGIFALPNVPAKPSESPGPAGWERSNERTYSWMHR
jgi:hypothetical protein